MYLVKFDKGLFRPTDSSDQDKANKMPIGQVVKVSAARNYKFHKKAFALLNLGHENQEKFESFEIYRKAMTILAGFYDEVELRPGTIAALPHSLSFDAMNAETFEKWYSATLEVLAGQMQVKSEQIRNQIDRFY